MALALLLAVPSCSKKNTPARESAAEAQKASDLASEVRDLEQQEEKLRREIELEKLAMEREELRLQREALATKGQRLSEEELALEKQKTELAKQQANDADARARAASSTPAPQQPPITPLRPAPAISVPVSSIGDYDYSIFYNRLTGHGTWFQSSDYGYVWRPNIVVQNRDWRPYTIGRWAYTDCGWTWISTEPFGWATYHYGRWVLLRNSGWCWIPGNEWAPAWVCWKSSGDYVGWAPLPPESLYWRGNDWNQYYGNASCISPRCFNFVRVNAFGGSIVSVVLSVSDCVRVYQQTNYCGGYRWDQRRVHCDGVSYDFISRCVPTPLPRYHCDFDARPPTHLDPVRYVATRGDRLSIHAPNFNVPWNGALRPSAIESKPLRDEVIRENGVAPEWRSRFAEARALETRQAEESMRTGLARKMAERIALEEKIQVQRGELASTLQSVRSQTLAQETKGAAPVETSTVAEKETMPDIKDHASIRPSTSEQRDPERESIAPIEEQNPEVTEAPQPGRPRPGTMNDPKPGRPGQGVAEGPQPGRPVPEFSEGPQPGRPRPGTMNDPQPDRPGQGVAEGPQPGRPAPGSTEGPQPGRPRPGTMKNSEPGRPVEVVKENSSPGRPAQEEVEGPQPGRPAPGRPDRPSLSDRDNGDPSSNPMRRQQEQVAEKEQMTQAEQEAAARAQQAAMQQQREAADEAMQRAQQAQMQKQQAEQVEKAAEEQARQQQAAAMREAEERAREQQMQQQQNAAREAQERAQAEKMQQQEAMREAQERAREEQMRQQQEAAREAQEAARQEQMRQQQEAMREAQERAREEQMRQQQEAKRGAREQARDEQQRPQREAQRGPRAWPLGHGPRDARSRPFPTGSTTASPHARCRIRRRAAPFPLGQPIRS